MSIIYEKSFAMSPVSIWWSSKNTLRPSDVSLKSHSPFWFNCPDCTHEFEQILYTIKERHRCPYCSSPPKRLCNDLNCKSCFNKSFSSHEKAKYWYENDIDSRFVFKSSTQKYKFKCNICGHIFNDTPNHITNSKRWCPYCCIPAKALCSDNECEKCFNKSFESHFMAKSWSSKNNISPRSILKCSNIKYIFNCSKCNFEFMVAPNTIQGEIYCPMCFNKTERLLYDWLNKNYNNIKYQPRYDWCKNIKSNIKLPFDFEYQNIIIELDGPQHFKQISNWKSPEEQRIIDKYKMNCALQNNKHIIRISQEEVIYNRNDWSVKLINTINELISTKEPSIKYIGVDLNYFKDL
jgi:hypothetical protein